MVAEHRSNSQGAPLWRWRHPHTPALCLCCISDMTHLFCRPPLKSFQSQAEDRAGSHGHSWVSVERPLGQLHDAWSALQTGCMVAFSLRMHCHRGQSVAGQGRLGVWLQALFCVGPGDGILRPSCPMPVATVSSMTRFPALCGVLNDRKNTSI